MADSDNTTTLPAVTRGRKRSPLCSTDNAIAVSLRWLEAHACTLELCERQQALEAKLLGDPQSNIERNDVVQYEMARAAENSAAAYEQRLLARLARTRAKSIAGVIAKLAVVVRETEDNTDLSEFPLPQVRSALEDLKRLRGLEAFGEPSCHSDVVTAGPLTRQTPQAIAAWLAFNAWSQGKERDYEVWTAALKAMKDI